MSEPRRPGERTTTELLRIAADDAEALAAYFESKAAKEELRLSAAALRLRADRLETEEAFLLSEIQRGSEYAAAAACVLDRINAPDALAASPPAPRVPTGELTVKRLREIADPSSMKGR